MNIHEQILEQEFDKMKDRTAQYAYIGFRMWEGDDVLDQFVAMLVEDGFIDDDQEWICEDD